jgi:cytochrome c oxidase subunit 2
MLGFLTKIHLMSKLVAPRVLGLVLSVLFTFTAANVSFASQHEEVEHTESVVLNEGNLQDEKWAEAPSPQNLDNKRFSQYAIDMQLENGSGAVADSDKSTFYFLITLIVILLLVVLGVAGQLLSGLRKISGDTSEPNFNKINANLMLLFLVALFVGIAYEIGIHSEYLLPESASVHGKDIDNIMWITAGITGFVFVVTQILLFWFAFRYQKKDGQKAIYYPKNDKLELIWTSVPALVLTVLVLFGFRIWVNTTITAAAEEDVYEVELYAYQFGWKFRYPGPDGKLGKTDYRLTQTEMPNGLPNAVGLDLTDPASADDVLQDELVLPKGKQIRLRMRSQDVLHSALLPHFRAQMYCVPGTPTQFNLTAKYTTEEFRDKIGNPDFNFELACNQICGANHYNMKRYIRVVEESDYVAWLNELTPAMATGNDNNDNKLTLK